MSSLDSEANATRAHLDSLQLDLGIHIRLRRMLYGAGVGNGTLLILPYDHGVEHGPIDFLDNPRGSDPAYILDLAVRGRCSAVAMHLAIAKRYYRSTAGAVPLIVKLNGKTTIPASEHPFSPLTGEVEAALQIGADAVGYTLYVGSSQQDRDLAQLRAVRREADRLGVPLVVWAYPRGEHVDARGGRDSLYAVDYAARVALEMGADVVKLNLPKRHAEGTKPPQAYASLTESRLEMTRRVVSSAQNTLVVFSGGQRRSDADVLEDVEMAMRAGAAGTIVGRNAFQRSEAEADSFLRAVHDALRKFPR